MSIKESNKSIKRYYAIISGLCASGASFFGKLCGDDDGSHFYINFSNSLQIEAIWILRIICFLLMIMCNTFVWTFFVKSLQDSSTGEGGTLAATVTSAATNYFLSFVLGAVVFGEEMSILSMMGIILILVGLIFLIKNNVETIESTKEK